MANSHAASNCQKRQTSSKLQAKAEDGVLTVTVPKKEPENQPEFQDIAIE